MVFIDDICGRCGGGVSWSIGKPTVRCILCERAVCGKCKVHIHYHRDYDLEGEWACGPCWENHLRWLGPEDDKPPPLPDIFSRPEE